MLPKDIFLQKIAAKQFREAVTDNFHNDELHSGQYRLTSLCCPCAVLGLRHRRIQKCISDVFPLNYGISQAILRNVLHRLLPYTNRNNGYILRHLREAAKFSIELIVCISFQPCVVLLAGKLIKFLV